MIEKKIDLRDIIPLLSELPRPVYVSESNLPLHVFVRLVMPERTSWKYITTIESLDDSTIDYFNEHFLYDLYTTIEFVPELAKETNVAWAIEFALYRDKTGKSSPKGDKVFSERIYLHKPETTGYIPKRMEKYIQKKQEPQQEVKEIANEVFSPLDILKNIPSDKLILLAQAGLINLNALLQPQPQLQKVEQIEKQVEKAEKVKEDIEEYDKIIAEVKEKPAQIKEDIDTNQGNKMDILQFIMQLPEILKAVKEVLTEGKTLLSEFGFKPANSDEIAKLTEVLYKHQIALQKIAEDVNKLKAQESDIVISLNDKKGGE